MLAFFFFFLLLSDRHVLARSCRVVLEGKGRLKRRGKGKKREKGEEGRELVCMTHRAQIANKPI